jgi:PAS domain S-box-containing protein
MKNLADRRFAGLLDAVPDAVVCVAQDGRIAMVNAQAERLFGYRRDELVGQLAEVLVAESERESYRRDWAEYVADPGPRATGSETELTGQRRDGSTFPAELSLSAVDTDEGLLVTAAVRDVSERLAAAEERERFRLQAERDRLERQVQESRRLESLGQLAGGVAHDFNNLLGVILSYAGFVADGVRPAAGEEPWSSVLADIEQVQLAAQRASGLTHQLLAFARREVVQPQVLSVNEVVSGVLTLLRRTLGEHVELVTGLEEGLGLVLADPGQLEQILVNLAVNARDAMPGGGTLAIETTGVAVDAAYAADRANLAQGRYVALKVSDNGAGMPAEVTGRALEPFFTTKPKGQGSGLGLATCYGIVTQAGGDLRIYSEPGLGTTVTVLLPVTDRQPSAAAAGPEAGAVPGGGGELVLVVEDEAALREVTRRMLARNGYRVIVAANGKEAIAAARGSAERIDGLVTDVVMPGMQGREVAERIAELQPGIGVLFMSGYTHGLLGAQGVLEPGVNLIAKPFTEAALLKGVQAIVRSRQRG